MPKTFTIDPDFGSVSNCVQNQAQDGDTIKMNAGAPPAWTNAITINKSLTVEGTGWDGPAITVLTGAVNQGLFNVTAAPGRRIVIGNFKTAGGGQKLTLSGSNYNDQAAIAAGIAGVRVHHIYFTSTGGYGHYVNQGCCGVMDHCYIPKNEIQTGENSFLTHTTWGNTEHPNLEPQGDTSWASVHSFPTSANPNNGFRNWFYEDCVIGRTTDGKQGGRGVWRHCTASPAGQGIVTHGGLDSSARGRGTMMQDVYNSIWVKAGLPGLIGSRGGAGRWFNNYGEGPFQAVGYTFYIYRGTTSNPSFGGADGRCPFDRNATGSITHPTISPAHTHAPTLGNHAIGEGDYYAQATYSGPNIDHNRPAGASSWSGSFTADITLSGIGTHPANCFRHYTMTNMNQAAIANPGPDSWYQYIAGNEATVGTDTVIHLDGIGGGNDGVQKGMRFYNGDVMRIYKVDSFCDSIGRGQGPEIDTGPAVVGQPFNDEANWGIFIWKNFKKATGAPNSSYGPCPWVPPTLAGSNNKTSNASGPANTLAQAREDRDVFNRAPTSSGDLCGDYNWNPAATGTDANYVGADDEIRNLIGPWTAAGSEALTYDARFRVDGTGGVPYPHPLVTGIAPPGVPSITSDTAVTFAADVAGGFSCSASPKRNCFLVTTANFSATPTIAIISGTLPTDVGFLDNGNGTATISGNAHLATPGQYKVTIRASHAPDTPADQDFTLTISAHPDPTVTLDAPTAGASFSAPGSIDFAATAGATGANITKVEYFQGSTKVGTGTVAPTYPFTWTSVGAGSYSLTAKATDSLGATAISSPARSITVTASPTLAAPTIVVTG